jgi:ribose 5-phosphate isomerase B
MSKKIIAFAADHAGFELKEALKLDAESMGWEVLDLGTNSAERSEATDFPEFAQMAVAAIKDGRAQRALLICGTGFGMAMAANRHKGIRAAAVHDVTTARLCRQHNDANVLCLGARIIGPVVAKDCLISFFEAEFEGGRYQRRVDKLG